jgi:hypothetical protein
MPRRKPRPGSAEVVKVTPLPQGGPQGALAGQGAPQGGLQGATGPVEKKHKDKIPKAVREQLWLRDVGEHFYGKCKTPWCRNRVSVWDFQCGHNIPESKGGATNLENLFVICSRCNGSMGNQYTFSEWAKKFNPSPKTLWRRMWSWLKGGH